MHGRDAEWHTGQDAREIDRIKRAACAAVEVDEKAAASPAEEVVILIVIQWHDDRISLELLAARQRDIAASHWPLVGRATIPIKPDDRQRDETC